MTRTIYLATLAALGLPLLAPRGAQERRRSFPFDPSRVRLTIRGVPLMRIDPCGVVETVCSYGDATAAMSKPLDDLARQLAEAVRHAHEREPFEYDDDSIARMQQLIIEETYET